MLNQAVLLLLDMVLLPYIAILLLRFHFSWLNVPMRNMLGEFVMTLTNFIVLPVRRVIPAVKRLDMATLLLACVFELLYLLLLAWGRQVPMDAVINATLPLLTALKLLVMSIYLLMIAVLVQAVLSWVNAHSPFAPVLSSITSPFLNPIRRVVPMIGMVDLSSLVLFILCNLLLIPLSQLEFSLLGGVG